MIHRPMKYSILIPIGKYSFFVEANIKNIFEMAGEFDVDIVFLTSKTVDLFVENALLKAERKYNCVRHLSAPFNSGENHLKLLDWGIRQPGLTEWVVVQHCDTFWNKPWLYDVHSAINESDEEVATIVLPNFQYLFEKQVLPLVGDSFGVYKKSVIIENNYTFEWNHFNEGSVSKQTKALMDSGVLKKLNGQRFKKNEFLDGSEIMSLEMIAKNPKMIKVIFPTGFVHLLAFYRISDAIKWDAKSKTLNIDLPWLEDFGGCTKDLWVESIVKYSFLTSLVFDKKEISSPFPWCHMQKIGQLEHLDFKVPVSTCEWLQRYCLIDQRNIIGMNDYGIEVIQFKNKRYEMK